MHLIADAIGTRNLSNANAVSDFVLDAVKLLALHLRHLEVMQFSNGTEYGPGVSAVGLLTESHINVHTAPERNLIQLCVHSCKPFKAPKLLALITETFGVKGEFPYQVLREGGALAGIEES